MLKNIKFILTDLGIIENNFSTSIIHLQSPFLDSHVLCGQAYNDEFCEDSFETKERVNCENCINIIIAIKSVKKSQLNLSGFK